MRCSGMLPVMVTLPCMVGCDRTTLIWLSWVKSPTGTTRWLFEVGLLPNNDGTICSPMVFSMAKIAIIAKVQRL